MRLSCDWLGLFVSRRGRIGRRPFLGHGGAAVDPFTSPVDEAWLAGGDLLDVIRATGLRWVDRGGD